MNEDPPRQPPSQVKSRREHVAEELSPDRPPPRRGPVDGHARGLQEPSERGRSANVVAAVGVRQVRGRRLDAHRCLDHAVARAALDGESGVGHHLQHAVVVLKDLEHDALDAARSCAGGELLEQARANADPLQLVGDGECHLRRGDVAQAIVGPKPDDPFVVAVAERPDECAAVDAIRVEYPATRSARGRTAAW